MQKSFASQNVTALFLMIAGVVATVYLLFVFSNALWESQRKEKLFEDFQREIQKLEEENQTLSERFSFQNTEQFIDKYAKSNLGLVNPGEKVIILPEEVEENPLNFEGLTQEEIDREILKNMPIRKQWWYFFFEA